MGYARVSTGDQDVALQVDALNASRYHRVFVDHISGTQSRGSISTACSIS